MLQISIYLFPLIAIISGVASLVSVIRFVKYLHEDSKVIDK